MTDSDAKRDRLLRRAALIVLLTSLCVATLVPVYTDEIGWRFHMRAAIDGVDIMFNDLCGPGSLATPAWFMWPARWYSAAANMALAEPVFVRAAGVACAAIWIGLFTLLTRRVEFDRARRARLQAILFALLSMGFLPFLIVLSRPEQPVLLAVTAIILVAVAPVSEAKMRFATWLKIAAILLLAVVALSYHIKGVLYSVVAFACIYACGRGRGTIAPRVIGGLAMLALTAMAARYWTGRFRCPGDDAFAVQLARENIAAVLSQGGSLGDLAMQALIGANPLHYIGRATPNQWPMSNWLPPEMFSGATSNILGLIIILAWLAAFGLTLLSLAGFLRHAGWRGLFEPRVLIVGAIIGCVLVWGASQLNKNVYEAAHILPMLLIAFAIAWSLPGKDNPNGVRVPRFMPLGFVGMAVIVQAIVLGSSAGPLYRAVQSPGYPERQPFSVSLADYDNVRADIDRAMERAGIPAGQPLERLLIDDLTYLALQEHRLPLHRLGVLSTWTGSIDDPVAYLLNRDSDGVIVGCQYLPADMEQAAARSGDVCAISRTGLARLGED